MTSVDRLIKVMKKIKISRMTRNEMITSSITSIHFFFLSDKTVVDEKIKFNFCVLAILTDTLTVKLIPTNKALSVHVIIVGSPKKNIVGTVDRIRCDERCIIVIFRFACLTIGVFLYRMNVTIVTKIPMIFRTDRASTLNPRWLHLVVKSVVKGSKHLVLKLSVLNGFSQGSHFE